MAGFGPQASQAERPKWGRVLKGSFLSFTARTGQSADGPGPDIVLAVRWSVGQSRQTARCLPMKTKRVGDGDPGFAADEGDYRLEFRSFSRSEGPIR